MLLPSTTELTMLELPEPTFDPVTVIPAFIIGKALLASWYISNPSFVFGSVSNIAGFLELIFSSSTCMFFFTKEILFIIPKEVELSADELNPSS